MVEMIASAVYAGAKVARSCEHCAAAFMAWPSNVNRGNGRFCSAACKYAWRKAQPSSSPTVNCQQCGQAFQCVSRKPAQRFCSKRCKGAWFSAQPKKRQRSVFRHLRRDEPVPPGQPSRCKTQAGYIVLSWKVAPYRYVRAFEHQIVTGRVARFVHHINGVRDDNRPENLLPIDTQREHLALHATWDIELGCELYRAGQSLTDLHHRFGKALPVIRAALRLRGVQMRSREEGRALRKQQRAGVANG